MTITTEIVPYAIEGSPFDVFVARPGGSGARPAVLIVHAFAGREEFAESKARAFAELGYVGAAIDLYGVGKRGTDRATSQALMMELIGNPSLLRKRIAAAFETVRALTGVDQNRIGAIGFCSAGCARCYRRAWD